jgi:hypothetical protein
VTKKQLNYKHVSSMLVPHPDGGFAKVAIEGTYTNPHRGFRSKLTKAEKKAIKKAATKIRIGK